MSVFRSMLKTGVAMKAFDMAKKELAKPENQRKAKALATRAQAEFRKPENQQKAKDLVGKVSKRVPGRSSSAAPTPPPVPKTLPPAG